MQLIFNELSLHPLTTDRTSAYKRMETFFETVKAAKICHPAFNGIRFEQEFSNIMLTGEYSLEDWLREPAQRTRAMLLRGLARRPFIDTDDKSAEESYITYRYYHISSSGEQTEAVGLAAAHIYQMPAISFADNEEFRRVLIDVLIVSEETQDEVRDSVRNVFSPDNFRDSELVEWLNEPRISSLSSKEELLSAFPDYEFTEQAIADVLAICSFGRKRIDRLILLLRDIKKNPHQGGLGKTEVLSSASGLCSKRLTDEDRIVYSLKDGVIRIIACKGHYDNL